MGRGAGGEVAFPPFLKQASTRNHKSTPAAGPNPLATIHVRGARETRSADIGTGRA